MMGTLTKNEAKRKQIMRLIIKKFGVFKWQIDQVLVIELKSIENLQNWTFFNRKVTCFCYIKVCLSLKIII